MYAISIDVIGAVSGEHWTKFVEKNILLYQVIKELNFNDRS